MSISTQVNDAAKAITSAIAPREPKIGLVLGSGLGSFAETLGDAVAVPYDKIPGYAMSKVKGHAGRLVAGKCGEVPVLVMQGRVHLYEGHPIGQIVLPIRSMVAAGCTVLVITNAAGGVRAGFSPGDLVVITDHINLAAQNPLTGPNEDALGPRFPDMSNTYDADLRQLAHKAALAEGVPVKEGVYGWFHGPSYETPAEIRMLRTVGGDLVGMSTVPEVIAAHHMGARILGISCVTNMAAGLGGSLSHDEVKETAQRVETAFTALLNRVVSIIDDEGL
jgi:purine-nucleoside phosphorylase